MKLRATVNDWNNRPTHFFMMFWRCFGSAISRNEEEDLKSSLQRQIMMHNLADKRKEANKPSLIELNTRLWEVLLRR